ncbi:PLP-dependent aminotransferase family protein [Devosia sp. XJ19-1]|uniref:PLP-dependent aminotransferase family protein n=1 Tax=Devosia ureilytica TaxID=2952754 RepID=A0A9Q4ALS8_9HYPH|nr:PLP-dependent aminotransferase family protein [Devosia ureilytica]MCP8881930.1 PLP-dependent aminotransferase family protein [Devosia ureilytica]MCP8886184.1 PLP-dependent aminotransferase family protein [Devosia ureilytica]
MALLPLSLDASAGPLQVQLRHALVAAIDDRRLNAGQKLPPSRVLAQQLGIARNTVTAVYDDLAVKGYLVARERTGFFVGERRAASALEPKPQASAINWDRKFVISPSTLRHIRKPANWQSYRYPFIYGQVDPTLFPIGVWRACSRDALGRAAIDYWAADRAVEDDPMFVEQICRQLLPARGIFARPEEVMITLGAQHGIYLIAQLLLRPGLEVGVEDPGYPDAKNIFLNAGAALRTLPVDTEGAIVSKAPRGLTLAMVTPTCQCPTTVTMSAARRQELLDFARRNDTIIVEDDYEGETINGPNVPALKSMDTDGRVLYLGTLSKVLAPGVRLGYLVAPAPVIAEAKALRRLMHRSAPLNNQRTAAIFLADGHYRGLAKTLRATLAERRSELERCIDDYLPGFERPDSTQGACVWLKCPKDVDGRDMVRLCEDEGVMIESGDPFVSAQNAGRYVRLGISSIDVRLIEPGIKAVAQAVANLRGDAGPI